MASESYKEFLKIQQSLRGEANTGVTSEPEAIGVIPDNTPSLQSPTLSPTLSPYQEFLDLQAKLKDDQIDKVSGAPFLTRMRLSGIQDKDLIPNLQQEYGDENVKPYGEDNAIFRMNKDSPWTLYDEEGVSVKDVADGARLLTQLAATLPFGYASFGSNALKKAFKLSGKDLPLAMGASSIADASAGFIWNLMAEEFGDVIDTRTPKEKSVLFLTEAGLGALGPVFDKLLSPASKEVVPILKEKLNDFGIPGFEPTRSQVKFAEGKTTEAIPEKALRGSPITQGPIDKRIQEQGKALNDAWKKAKGNAEKNTAKGIIDASKATQDALDKQYTRIYKFLQKSEVKMPITVLPELQAFDKEILALYAGKQDSFNKNFPGFIQFYSKFKEENGLSILEPWKLDELGSKGNVHIDSLLRLQDNIRQITPEKRLELGGRARGLLNELEDAIITSLKAFKPENKYRLTQPEHAEVLSDIELDKGFKLIKSIPKTERKRKAFREGTISIRDLGNMPEDEVFRVIKDSSRDNGKLLSKIEKVLGKNKFDNMAQTLVYRLGTDNKGEFSPSKFIEEYQRLSFAGKNVLFRHNPEQKQALDELLKASKAFELINPSMKATNSTLWQKAISNAGSIGLAGGILSFAFGNTLLTLGSIPITTFLQRTLLRATLKDWSKSILFAPKTLSWFTEHFLKGQQIDTMALRRLAIISQQEPIAEKLINMLEPIETQN